MLRSLSASICAVLLALLAFSDEASAQFNIWVTKASMPTARGNLDVGAVGGFYTP
jgi:hypothetical protein